MLDFFKLTTVFFDKIYVIRLKSELRFVSIHRFCSPRVSMKQKYALYKTKLKIEYFVACCNNLPFTYTLLL